MSTQTITPTPVTVTANRIRTALGWIDHHRDQLPPGMSLRADVLPYAVALNWWSSDCDPVAADAALTALLGEPDSVPGYWPAEGDRPEIHVYGLTGEVTA